MRWTTRSRNLSILAALFAAAVVGFVLVGRGAPIGVRASLLNAAPRDSFLVATIDVQSLRTSPLADTLLGSGTGTARALPGMNELTSSCGFDPLAKVKEIVVALPEGGEPGEIGVAASGDIDADAFGECAKKAIALRGGRAKVTHKGAYTIVEDDDPSGSSKGPRVAIRDGGVVLVGRGAWLTAMMDAADGTAPSVQKNEQHMELRGALSAAHPTLLVTAILPRALRDRLKRDMGAELDSEDRAKLEMGGVLAVQAAGLALMIGSGGASGQETKLDAELRCESATACNEVKSLIERKRLAASQDLGLRLVGLGSVIDSLTVTTRGSSLTASAHAPTDELGKTLDRVLRMRDRRAKAANSAAPTDPARAPDEVLSARPKPPAADASVGRAADGGTR